ncbi:hypothetical protein G3N28_10910 [Desulfobacter hydrogenophilus]|nr:hypothetical protein [Desulfobacter hydrogenophilus]NDY72554.1 hypothetical protein [Desulfobacter hydrogenophilus]
MAYENVSTENLGELTVLSEQREQVKISTLWRKKNSGFGICQTFWMSLLPSAGC